MENNTIKVFLYILLFCFLVDKIFSKKEGFQTSSIPGYNNLVLSDINGNMNSISFPKGMIMAYYGNISSIPSGWALCDGTNGTPDLRGRFILGVNPNANKSTSFTVREMNITGGSETHTLTIGEMPSHRHSFGRDWWGLGPDREGVDLGNVNDQGSSGTDESGKTTYTGGQGGTSWTAGTTAPHNNMPPFFTLAYLMKL